MQCIDLDNFRKHFTIRFHLLTLVSSTKIEKHKHLLILVNVDFNIYEYIIKSCIYKCL